MAYSGSRVRRFYGRARRGINKTLLSRKRAYGKPKYAPVKASYNKSSYRGTPTGVRIRETERVGIQGGSITTVIHDPKIPSLGDVPAGGAVEPRSFHLFDLNGSMLSAPAAPSAPVNAKYSTDKGLIVNPSLPNTFPWLSSMAALYERYRVNKLIFRYRTQARTDLPGNIVMAFEKDVHNLVTDESPAGTVASSVWVGYDKAKAYSALQKLTQTTTYLDGAPWKNFTLVVPVNSKVYYTRDIQDRTFSGDATYGFTDAANYDFGKFYLGYENIDTASGASAQAPTTIDMGILEIEYDITFLNRRAPVVMDDPDNVIPK